jgi:predicted cupin superfamily sugar epimerase
MLDPDDLRRRLQLVPHPAEGGWFAETYRSAETLEPAGGKGRRAHATAIYYLLTPETFSAMHRLAADEIFHFYLGDPVEMLELDPEGGGRVLRLGTDLASGMRPQIVVPRGVWQGSRLVPGGRLALLGTTVSPGFEFDDYEPGERDALAGRFPEFRDLILALTRRDPKIP